MKMGGKTMDFKRSTIVLIIGFFLLDLFLFGIFLQMRGENSTRLNPNINVLDQMRNDGIAVTGVSTTLETLPMIQMTPVSIEGQVETLPNQIADSDRGVITSQLLIPIQLSLDNVTNVTMENFNELTSFVEGGNIINGDQYTWFSYNPNTRRVVYTQRANRTPVVDGTGQIVFTLNTNNQVISYEQTYAGTSEVLGSSRSLITAQRALEVLYLAGRIPARATITTVRLAYYQSLKLADVSIYSPAWYVEIRQTDGQIVSRRVDAIRGTVLTNDATEAVNTGTTTSTTTTTSP